MTTRLALALMLAGTLAKAAGDGERAAPRTWITPPDAPWARVTQEQIDAAEAAGVPVARVAAARTRFVFIPAGTFEREVDGGRYEVNLGVGYYIQEDTDWPAPRDQIPRAAAEHAAGDPLFDGYRLPTEAEWEHAQRFLHWDADQREWMLDRFGPLPTWTVSDPHGPREGDTYVVRTGPERHALPADADAEEHRLAYRLVCPLGYGLGKYGSTEVTFRLYDEFAAKDAKPIPGGYDLRVISMNDRLQARTMGEDREWTLVPDPGSPVTLTMVPGAYYVYAERTEKDGRPLRGKEMKFYVHDKPVERSVPIPEKDQMRYGSGGREKPQ